MRPFTGPAAVVAWTAAAGGIAYGVAFAVLGNVIAASILLTVGASLTVLILGALVASVDDTPQVRLALAVGTVGALASAAHGIYDLANQIHPPSGPSLGDLPHPVDPRGFATFGLVGVAMLLLAGPMGRNPRYGKGLGGAAGALGLISVVIFLGRLIILDPTNPIVRLALVAGVVANTVFAVWLGRRWSESAAMSEPAGPARGTDPYAVR